MPIKCARSLTHISQDDFKALDYAVTGHAFKTHTALGRLFDEGIYTNELRHRLTTNDIEAEQEVEIIVSHKEYNKSYFIDLLVNNSIPYELKTSDDIHPKHSAQLLNYLYLTNINHGKILNFRPKSLQTRFVSTSLTELDRKQYNITKSNWIEIDTNRLLLPLLHELLNDWGTHLPIELYQEALLTLTRRDGIGDSTTAINQEGRNLGHQKLPLLNPNCILYLSATNKFRKDYKRHIERLLSMTPLHTAQWINMNGSTIELQSIFV